MAVDFSADMAAVGVAGTVFVADSVAAAGIAVAAYSDPETNFDSEAVVAEVRMPIAWPHLQPPRSSCLGSRACRLVLS